MSGGSLILTKEELLSHVHKAAKICTDVIIAQIKEALKLDEARRTDSSLFSQLKAQLKEHETPIAPLRESELTDTKKHKAQKKQPKNVGQDVEIVEEATPPLEPTYKVNKKKQVSSVVPLKGNWKINESVSNQNRAKVVDSLEEVPESTSIFRQKMKTPGKTFEKEIMISSDEDEQVTVVL